jgi:hypothetical protein
MTKIDSQKYGHQTEDTVPLDRLKLLGIWDSTQDSSIQAVMVVHVLIECGTWTMSDLTCKGAESITDSEVMLLEEVYDIVRYSCMYIYSS